MYKNKLIGFIYDLNKLVRDELRVSRPNTGEFLLKINDEVKFENGNIGVVVDLWFKEGSINHVIYHSHLSGETIDLESFFRQVYMDIFKTALLSIDAIGCYKDVNGNVINILSFQTLLESGLEKLKVGK